MQFHDIHSLSQLIFSEFFLDLGLGIHLSDRLESGFDQIRRIAGTQGFRQNVDHTGETEDGTINPTNPSEWDQSNGRIAADPETGGQTDP